MIARIRHPGRFAAALIALLMLSYASVQSLVMQAAMPSAGAMTPLCGGPLRESASMAGMGMEHDASATPSHRGGPGVPHSQKSACPYCAAAAHLPVMTSSAPIPRSCAVAFAGFRMAAVRGPRGPPAVRPRARGPPVPA